MASYCPHCGTPSADEARFCTKCGRERLPVPPVAPPPAAPPAGPPPPAYAPGAPAPEPAQPTAVGLFLGRALRGDWASAAKAVAWPVALLLVLAVAAAVPSYGQEDEVVVGWSDRLRIALALLLQAFGGGFGVAASGGRPHGGGYGYGDGDAFGQDGAFAQGGAELSLVPLTVTALWAAAVYVGARRLRSRGEGADVAVRTGLLGGGVVLVLGLFARPEVAGVEVSSSAPLAALGALVLTAAVSAGVLGRDTLERYAPLRALGTAVRVLGVLVAVCAVVGFVACANGDDVDGRALLLTLPVLPNIGLAVLGLSWGVPVEYDLQGRFDLVGPTVGHGGVGLPEIGDELGAGAVAGLVALGVAAALTLGLWAARRTPDRSAHLLTAGCFLGLYLLLTAVSGVSGRVSGAVDGFGGQGAYEVAPSGADALLFGLLWTSAATLAAPALLRVLHRAPSAVTAPAPPPAAYPAGPAAYPQAPSAFPAAETPETPETPEAPVMPAAPEAPAALAAPAVPVMPAVPQAPVVPAAPAASEVPAVPQAPVVPAAPQAPAAPAAPPAPQAPLAPQAPAGVSGPADPRPGTRRVGMWVAVLAGAFVVGGGATAGALLLRDGGAPSPVGAAPSATAGGTASPGPTAGDAKPAPAPSRTPSPAPSATATPVDDPVGATPPAVPEGYRLVSDTAGFSFAVPSVWDRVKEEPKGQITYAGSTGMAHFLVGVIHDAPYTSLENLTTLEANSRKRNAGYQRLRLEANTFQGRPGAIWEYTYTDEGGRTIHAVDQSYIAADGTEYAVYFTAQEDAWDTARETFQVALDTWTLNDVD
ncbi:zinc-ribbon domain-containing protein [Streptomyces sp. NRRL S-118]|uniref:zinc-ribbon domain-containing protein n=1 Tax=Streptomyces sp. NRRL S-118 TaxID=1463881 RepID=UPI0005868658|nr:zinc-ribbon domain-containing protein [Streptomyces sp. NRRL S-118]